MLPFQKELVRGILRHSTVAFSVARGNGKTTFMAAIAAAAVAGPMAIPRGEITLVAASFKQAKKAFTHCLWLLKPLIAQDPERWRITDNDHASRIEDRKTGAYLWTIGSDPAKAHGLAPYLAILRRAGAGGARMMVTGCIRRSERVRENRRIQLSLRSARGRKTAFIGFPSC